MFIKFNSHICLLLQQDILDITSIFKDMAVMVEEQGEVLSKYFELKT